MKKKFKDVGGESIEPARFIGKYKRANVFESESIYFTHMIRLEYKGKVSFLYDPGKVWRYNKIKGYPLSPSSIKKLGVK